MWRVQSLHSSNRRSSKVAKQQHPHQLLSRLFQSDKFIIPLAGQTEDKILAPACMSTALIRPFIGCYCCRSLFNYQLNGFEENPCNNARKLWQPNSCTFPRSQRLAGFYTPPLAALVPQLTAFQLQLQLFNFQLH